MRHAEHDPEHSLAIGHEQDVYDFAQLERELLDEGWQHGAVNELAAGIDRHIVEDGEGCPHCNGRMRYVPLRFGATCRCFAVCRACNIGLEF